MLLSDARRVGARSQGMPFHVAGPGAGPGKVTGPGAVGSAGGVMKEQLDHLLNLARHPFVQIQCVPSARGAHSAMDGSFVILEMSEAESLVYAEVPGAGHVIVDAQTVANSLRKFGALRSQALPHEETVRSIEARRGHLDD